MNISHRSKACLLFLTGASIIALQYWSDVQAQSRLEKRIEKIPQDNLGKCLGKDQVRDVACLIFLPPCSAELAIVDARAGLIWAKRDGFKDTPVWKIAKPGNAAKATEIFDECLEKTWWRCVVDPSKITGGSWRKVDRKDPPEKFVKAVVLEGKCKDDK
jgi:hypothetical protein